jgi:hypothetical protein
MLSPYSSQAKKHRDGEPRHQHHLALVALMRANSVESKSGASASSLLFSIVKSPKKVPRPITRTGRT